MPRAASTRLLTTQPSVGQETLNGKQILVNYNTLNLALKSTNNCCKQYKVKLRTEHALYIGHKRLTHEYLLSRIDRQPMCEIQRLTIFL